MLVRTFSADTADEALRRVRTAWGAEAVILSTYESPRGRGAEIRATIDEAAIGSKQVETPKTSIDEDLESRLRAELGIQKPSSQKERLRQALSEHRIERRLIKKLIDQAESSRIADDILALGSAFDSWGLFDPLPLKSKNKVLFFGLDEDAIFKTFQNFEARERLLGGHTEFARTDLPTWASNKVVPLATKVKTQNIEPVLVLPIAGSKSAREQGIDILAAMGGHRVVLTDVGATKDMGALISTGCHPRTRLAQVVLSEDNGSRLEVLNPLSLARLILNWH